jgi:hypothetical protein
MEDSELTGATGIDCLGFCFSQYPHCIYCILYIPLSPTMQVLLSDTQVSPFFIPVHTVAGSLPTRSPADRLLCSRAIPISHRPKRNFTSPRRSYLIIASSRVSFPYPIPLPFLSSSILILFIRLPIDPECLNPEPSLRLCYHDLRYPPMRLPYRLLPSLRTHQRNTSPSQTYR